MTVELNRTALIFSTVLLVAGVALLVYADPLARLSLSSSAPTRFSGTFTIPTGSFTFTEGTGFNFTSFTRGTGTGFPGGGGITTSGNATDEQVESLIAVALIGVGLVLEVMTILLWQGEPKQAPAPAEAE